MDLHKESEMKRYFLNQFKILLNFYWNSRTNSTSDPEFNTISPNIVSAFILRPNVTHLDYSNLPFIN